MKSPFPGMDPYLEVRWGDLHTRLIVYAEKCVAGLERGGCNAIHFLIEGRVVGKTDRNLPAAHLALRLGLGPRLDRCRQHRRPEVRP